MYGAIIGDLAGSIYEYEQSKQISTISNIGDIIRENSFFSDDTILTIAILDAILNNGDYSDYLKEYTLKFIDYKPNFKPYFNKSFSPNFIKCILSNEQGFSIGNGALMRISPIGYLFNSEKDIIENVKLATIPSHNSEEAISSAIIVALIIYLSRNGYKKEEIIKNLNLKFQYQPFTKFNATCYETLNNCLYALFTSNTYEESIKKIISYGGDTDTNACIVGAMAEAMFGIDTYLIEKAKSKIPDYFVNKLDKGYSLVKSRKSLL